MSVIAKAEETVMGTTPKVIEALGRIRFLLVVIPVISVGVGIVSQSVTSERNIGSTTFKMGTFATPSNPEPVLLANETQVKSRLRNYSVEMRETDYPKSLMLTAIVDSDVIVVTGVSKGPETTKMYLRDLVQKEIDFQNGRLEKLQAVQNERKTSLENTLADLANRSENLKQAMQSDPNPVALMAMQQGLDNAGARISAIKLELSTLDLLNASDLYIDTTQFIRQPFIVASSNWYRPLIFGALGLAVGLGLTFLIAIIAIIRAFTKGKDNDSNNKQEAEVKDHSASLNNADEPGS